MDCSNNRPLTKLAHVKQAQEAHEATKQVPRKVEFGNRSNIRLSWYNMRYAYD